MENKKLKTFDLTKENSSTESVLERIILYIRRNGLKVLASGVVLSVILLFIRLNYLNFNLNFFYFAIGEFLVIFLLFLFFLSSDTLLDEYLTLTLTVAFVAVSCVSFMFFRKIEVKPAFFYDIVTFEVGVIAFLIPLIFNTTSLESKKYSSSGIIRMFGYNVALPVFLLSSLNLMFIIILQLIPNLSKLEFLLFTGFIFSSFLITVFFLAYIGCWIVNLVVNFEKIINLLYQYTERYFESLNKKSTQLNNLLNTLQQLEENESNSANRDKIEKKINKLRPKISKKQNRFDKAIEKIGTILVDEIKEGENEELIIRKLRNIEDLVKKVFKIQRDYCYWLKSPLINQIINIYKVAVESQNKNIIISVCECINWIKDQLEEKEGKPSLSGDSLLRRMIEEEVLC